MSYLSSLPLELVVYIIQSVEDDKDLGALCTVSKTISAIAQPFLYREIDLEDCDGVHGTLSLFLLTRTITNSPVIAGWIHCLRIDAVATCGCDSFSLEPYGQILPTWNPDGKYGSNKIEIENFVNAVGSFVEKYDVSEFLSESNSKLNILAGLLVSCTSNLTKLTIRVNRNDLALLSALGQQSSIGHSSLSKIETLCLRSSIEATPKDELSFDSITSLLTLLPRLNTIWISGCLGRNNSLSNNKLDAVRSKQLHMGYRIAPQRLPITHLSFTKSCLTASNLHVLLSACKDLKVFSFTNRHKSQQKHRSPQFSPLDLYSALDCQTSTLEDLRVTLETDSIAQAFDWDGCTYGSFKKCTRLRFLEVDERFLGFPPAGLPDSLEYLVIQNCQSSIFGLLSYLASLVLSGKELTSLKTISIHAHDLFPGGMLGLPLKGATDLLFFEAQQDLLGLFLGTEVALHFESGLLERTSLGYKAASEVGYLGDYGPFVYVDNQKSGST